MKVGVTGVVFHPDTALYEVRGRHGAPVPFDGRPIAVTLRGGSSRSLRGKWALPGGAVDDGELPQSALEREVMEELGLRIHSVECVSVQQELVNGELWLNLVFAAEASEDTLENREPHKFDDVRWTAWPECPGPAAAITRAAAEAAALWYRDRRRAVQIYSVIEND
jgi:8-oxo-dGTP diphosphatase